MRLQEITELTDKKIKENPKKLIFTFFEMKVMYNLTNEELQEVLNLLSIRLQNIGYKVYLSGDTHVLSNELLVAIK